jgi:hypothetical protein
MKLKLNFMFILTGTAMALAAAAAQAQERAYFVTYDHHLEEPGALEVGLTSLGASQREGGEFAAGTLEVEYGLKGWWTTELYLFGAQGTRGEGALLTGTRWENRIRPLLGEHRVNPVLYVEVERVSGADKNLSAIVGHDVEADHAEPNSILREETKHEIETKLILSTNARGWNLSENLIAEKNFAETEWEFGYAVGVSRPLALAARPDPCSRCPENFTAGVEVYGGLGTHKDFGLRDTSHYLGLLLSWDLPGGTTFRVSPTFGLNGESHRFLFRFGVSHEIPGFGHALGAALGRRR